MSNQHDLLHTKIPLLDILNIALHHSRPDPPSLELGDRNDGMNSDIPALGIISYYLAVDDDGLVGSAGLGLPILRHTH